MYRIIAIDGPASSGKTSLAKKLSKKLNAPILFSGKLYRAIAFEMIEKNIKINQSKKILQLIDQLNEDKLYNNNLFNPAIDKISSDIATKPFVRNSLLKFQRSFPKKKSRNCKFVIIEGRDIGTVVFPNAHFKIFIWADVSVRAQRRYEQILKSGKKSSFKRVYAEIIDRDNKDLNRKVAPLKPAVNSVLLDTTYLDIEQSFNRLKKIIL
tara:strand:- start:2218 stop:2847 length:630 start_codon:yes stop_codon:yes gene_type:complete